MRHVHLCTALCSLLIRGVKMEVVTFSVHNPYK